MKFNSNTVFICLGLLLVGFGLGWFSNSIGNSKSVLFLKIGENQLKLDLQQDLENHEALLERLFSTDFSKAGTFNWLKVNQSTYKINDVDIINGISKLNYHSVVGKELRGLCIKRLGPWEHQVDSVKIGIPKKEDQPRIGHANVCGNGNLLNKTIELYNIDQTRNLKLKCTGRFQCPVKLKHPDIQLNSKDAEYLIGTSNFKEYEQGLSLILSDSTI